MLEWEQGRDLYKIAIPTNEGFLSNGQGNDLNSLGHRCKEIKDVLGDDLQFSKYFLVLGDNRCLHMHKPIEETWPYLLSKQINHQYYNLAVQNGGLDCIKFNLFNWRYKYSQPKMIFISCEWANSFLGVDYEDESVLKASELADTNGYWKGRSRMFSKLLAHIDIPIYQIVGPDDVPIDLTDTIKTIDVDVVDDANLAQIVSEGFLEAQRAISV